MEDAAQPPEPSPDDPWVVRRALGRATRADHARLNRHPLVTGITRPGFPLVRYGMILRAYHRFYAAMEPALLECIGRLGVPFDYVPRVKLPWLRSDLQALSLGLPEAPARGLFEPVEDSDLIGILYAIEGSTVGGQVVARHLAEHLGLGPDTGARFFNAYGPGTTDRWREFCAFAETIAGDPARCRRAATAAGSVFAALENLLDDCQRRTS